MHHSNRSTLSDDGTLQAGIKVFVQRVVGGGGGRVPMLMSAVMGNDGPMGMIKVCPCSTTAVFANK